VVVPPGTSETVVLSGVAAEDDVKTSPVLDVVPPGVLLHGPEN
jgi:hypothetical protein